MSTHILILCLCVWHSVVTQLTPTLEFVINKDTRLHIDTYVIIIIIAACSVKYFSFSPQMFLLVSFVALFTNGYFYCVCLMHVVVNNDILKRVLKSISKPGHLYI